MSDTVSKALLQCLGSEAEGTAELLSVVDRFFDCLNVHNLTEAKKLRKPFRSPYRSGTDWKLKVGDDLAFFFVALGVFWLLLGFFWLI